MAKEDLHIYIVDSDNLKQSIKLLDNKMKKRTRKDKEFWFIDISALHNIDNASSMMNMLDNLPLDVDDDIFLFMFIENNSARIWEMYKFAPEKDLIVKDFGNWAGETGLKLTNLEKWQRRGDLTVSILLSLKVKISTLTGPRPVKFKPKQFYVQGVPMQTFILHFALVD